MFNLSRQEKIVFLIIFTILLTFFGWKLYSKKSDAITIVSTVNPTEDTIEKDTQKAEEEICIVHVSGAVNNPGVYKVNKDKRIIDAVKIAGGETEKANVDAVNLAAHIYDGQKIVIPFILENNLDCNNQNVPTNQVMEQYQYSSDNTLINLNSASSHQLESLPGIGPVLAKTILEYREKNGLFRDTEDIKNVSGIGDKRYESIKEYITVY
jgi:competence protein ComEA